MRRPRPRAATQERDPTTASGGPDLRTHPPQKPARPPVARYELDTPTEQPPGESVDGRPCVTLPPVSPCRRRCLQPYGGGTVIGDLDGDGDVDAADLAILLGSWGPYAPCPPFIPADIDQNCDVDAADLAHLLGNWGSPAQRVQPAPPAVRVGGSSTALRRLDDSGSEWFYAGYRPSTGLRNRSHYELLSNHQPPRGLEIEAPRQRRAAQPKGFGHRFYTRLIVAKRPRLVRWRQSRSASNTIGASRHSNMTFHPRCLSSMSISSSRS